MKTRLRVLLSLLFVCSAPSLGSAQLVVSDFRTPGDALLVIDTATGLQWLSPLATNTVSYNQVVGGFDELVTTEGFSVASDIQVLDLFANNFDNPTTTPSSENVPKALAFFGVFGITQHVSCPGTTPPGACPRTQAWSLTAGGDLRALGMITIGDGALGYIVDFTSTVASQGDTIDGQRGTWLVRPDVAAPNTGSAYCFGDGSGAACPCGANGNPGEGCMSTSGTGARMTGTGDANLGGDTFTLTVSGAPANKPGLFFQGPNQVSNPAGDGIWCSNASMRYGVLMTDGAGTAVQGGLGANAAPGASLNYQYWFRDPGNSCGGLFNFSNAWTVTWE